MLFLLAVALTWLLTPRTARGDYEIEAEQPTEDAAQLRMVNINTASVDELDSLPGIGPVLAQRIVDWRTENGPFTDAAQLLEGGRHRSDRAGEHTRFHRDGGYAGMKILVVDDEKLLVKGMKFNLENEGWLRWKRPMTARPPWSWRRRATWI